MHAGVWNYAKTPRSQWIVDCLGMVTLAGSQVWWTWETEDSFRRVKEGNKHAMKVYTAKLTDQLGQLTGMVSFLLNKESKKPRWIGRSGSCTVMLDLLVPAGCHAEQLYRLHMYRTDCWYRSVLQVRGELTSEARRKVNTLIITDVHGRDIIDNFVRDSIMDAREFAWESQLRFYWDKGMVRQASMISA